MAITRLPISLYLKTTNKVDTNNSVTVSDYAKPTTLLNGISEVNTTSGDVTTSLYEGTLNSNVNNFLFTKYFRPNSGYFYAGSPSFSITSQKSSAYTITSSNDNFTTTKLGKVDGAQVLLDNVDDTDSIKAGMVISTEDNSTLADTDYVRVVSVNGDKTLTISSSKTISSTNLVFKNKSSDNKLFLKYFTVSYNNNVSTDTLSGEPIYFTHHTQALPSTSKFIKSLSINKENISYKGETRTFNVVGTPGAIFTLQVTKKTGTDTTYNFTSDTFTASATTLANQTIDSTGIYTDTIVFPVITADDTYEFLITAGSSTSLDSVVFGSSPSTPTFTLYQYAKITITFTLESSANSTSYVNYGSNYGVTNVTQDGVRDGEGESTFNIEWDISSTDASASNTFHKIREPLTSDWRNASGSIAKTVDGPTESTTGVDLKTPGFTTSLSTTDLVVGMVVSGENIDGSTTIASITDANTIVLSAAQSLGDEDRLIFDNGGTTIEFTELNVLLGDATETDETATTFTVDSATSSSTSVTITALSSIYDIKHHSTAAYASRLVSGLRTGVDTYVTAINYSTRTFTLSAAQSFEAGQRISFNTSKRAKIKATGKVIRFGDKSINVRLELDNLLGTDVS